MKQRILFLLRFYALSIVLFIVAKVVFMMANYASHPFGISDVYDVLRHGLTLDLSTALYFLVVPYILTIVSIWYTGNVLRWVYYLWSIITGAAFALAFAADTALYPHWGFKLDASCLQYLASPAEAAASVPTIQLVLGLMGLIVLIALMGWAYCKQYKPLKKLRKRWSYGIFAIVALPLIFIGIRGGVDESTTNIGQAYYSQTSFLNHSAVNPVFSFLSSFETTVRTDVRYHFFEQAECDSLLLGCYDTLSVEPDTLLRTQRPNIVLVMLESASCQFTKAGGRDYIMPKFNSLCDKGIYFSQSYANSFRTDRATVSIWGGYPSFPTMSLQKDLSKNQHLPGIARTLVDAGYDTRYFYGGDINFTKKKSYLVNAGFDRFTWKKDFSISAQRSAKWGVCDSIVFDRILQEISAWNKNDKTPHLIGYNTLSSHQPWDVPIHVLEDPVENAFHYLDKCIGEFIERLQQMPQWDNTLVIFIPDHGIGYYGMEETSAIRMQVPILWIGGAVRQPRDISVLCNQSDMAATLFGQMGIPHGHFRWSRDVLSKSYTRPFAYHTFNNGFSIVDSTGLFVYDLTANQPLLEDNERLLRLGKALLQATSDDLSNL